MTAPPKLRPIFFRLLSGHHMSLHDGEEFYLLDENFQAYEAYFAPLGLTLIKDPRDFFYFESDKLDASKTLVQVAAFSFILIDDAANQGRRIEQFLFGTTFAVRALPHFKSDRYVAHLRAVDVEDDDDLRNVLKAMRRYGWIVSKGDDQFQILPPFHRMLDKCLALAAPKEAPSPGADASPVRAEGSS